LAKLGLKRVAMPIKYGGAFEGFFHCARETVLGVGAWQRGFSKRIPGF